MKKLLRFVLAGAVLTAAVLFPSSALRAQTLFVGTSSGDLITSNFDGSNRTTYSFSGRDWRGLAVDDSAGKLYAIDAQNGGSLVRMNFDGSGLTTLIANLGGTGNAQRLEIDTTNGRLYWMQFGASRAITSSTLDGSGVQNVISLSGSFTSDALRLDVAAGKIYFTEYPANLIRSVNLNGTGAATVYSSAFQYNLAIDPAGDRIFAGYAGGVYAGNFAGTGSLNNVFNATDAMFDLAFNPVDGALYYTLPNTPGGGQVHRVGTDGLGDALLFATTGQTTALAFSSVSAIPEPSACAALIGAAAFGGVVLWRRRTRPMPNAS